ncbi:MAG: SDR family oxidoreductase [Deltaproteobacteria bacterium]|nr:SDR family oxidoreductase [Deltaproteobacteria bacterium]
MTSDLAGRTIVVTGANTGIGLVTARTLAQRGARVIMANRSEDKTRPILDELRAAGAQADFVALDLGDLASTRAAAARVRELTDEVHVLCNNAGLAGQRGLTKDGFELTFGVNHVGPFLFTQLLEPLLRAAAPSRIVNVASAAHYSATGIDWDAVRHKTRSTTGVPEYNVSKLANVLHAAELARRLAGTGVTSYALHPGVVASDVWRKVPWPVRPLIKLFMKSVEDGAKTSIYCAGAPEIAGDSGRYYTKCREKTPSKLAQDPALAAELWRRSAEWVA